MKKKQFSIDINATKEKVWNSLWEDANYRKWTSVFSPGSYAKSDWNEGDKILFLSGEGEGMYSVIDKKIPNEVMSFKHIGVIKNNVEQPLDEETKKWSGAIESYTLHEKDGKTHLTAELDLVDEHAEYFEKVFPEALKLVKAIAENN
jgi:hypothetical protein